jgi:serine/threonine protein kinase/Tol biopolymer transport system component
MTPERWARMKEIFGAALEMPEAERDTYLAFECGQDTELRSVIERLLVNEQNPDLRSPVSGMLRGPHAPAKGDMLGRYRIEEKLGEGGMGVVYRAYDAELRRSVAIKMLAPDLATDVDGRQRLLVEARAASAINHPHICTLHDIGDREGQPFLVMELLEGQTLQRHLAGKALKTEELLELGIQIASALEAAHARGIIHRDIKPANIFITKSGQAKVLDFGLAKLSHRPMHGFIGQGSQTASTESDHLTAPGAAMGTVAYMSPEQARGEELDVRTDLFSFGAVLYEMATGHPAFSAITSALIFDAILHQAPTAPLQLNPQCPPELERILNQALEKDREIRYQSAREVLVDLKRLKRDTVSTGTAARTEAVVSKGRDLSLLRRFAWAAVLLVAVVAAYLIWMLTGALRSSSPPPQPAYRQITFLGDAEVPAISPDGTLVAYVTGVVGHQQSLMLQDLKGGRSVELLKDIVIGHPRWSPDGSELAVCRTDRIPDCNMVLIPRLGGAPRFIGVAAFCSWSPDGNSIAIADIPGKGFRIVDRMNGSSKTVSLSGFEFMLDLDWSPKSNRIAILTYLLNARTAVWTVRADGNQYQKLVEEDRITSVRWSAIGDRVYLLREKDSIGELLSIPIDSVTGKALASPSTLLSGLEAGEHFTVSADGNRLVYTRSHTYSNLRLTRLHDAGKILLTKSLTNGTSKLDSLSISPDGKWIAFVDRMQIEKMPIEGGTPTQLTFSNFAHGGTAWSPDGKRIAFGSNEGGAFKLWIMDADGANLRQLAKTDLSPQVDGITWAPSRQILYEKPGNNNFGIINPATEEERPLLRNPLGWPFRPRYSRDGKKVVVFWNREENQTRGLWIISIMNNSADFLKGGEFYPIGWSADGSSIYAVEKKGITDSTEGDLVSVLVAGGIVKTIAKLPGKFSEVVISPDSKTVVYDAVETKSDVWMIENFDPLRATSKLPVRRD